MARGPAAQADATVPPGPPGGLHRSDPYLGVQAPPDGCASRIHTGGPHCLLGGQ